MLFLDQPRLPVKNEKINGEFTSLHSGEGQGFLSPAETLQGVPLRPDSDSGWGGGDCRRVQDLQGPQPVPLRQCHSESLRISSHQGISEQVSG